MLEGLLVATETPVVELEELQGIIAEGQERGLLASATLAAALEDVELSPPQAQDLFRYLEEHGIEVLDSTEPGPDPHASADAAREDDPEPGAELTGAARRSLDSGDA